MHMEVYHPCKLLVFLKEIFSEKLILKNIRRQKKNMKNFPACKELNTVTDFAQLDFKCLFVCFDSLHSSQQFFSHVRTGLPGLNQF